MVSSVCNKFGNLRNEVELIGNSCIIDRNIGDHSFGKIGNKIFDATFRLKSPGYGHGLMNITWDCYKLKVLTDSNSASFIGHEYFKIKK
jgi:hypothetical protein